MQQAGKAFGGNAEGDVDTRAYERELCGTSIAYNFHLHQQWLTGLTDEAHDPARTQRYFPTPRSQRCPCT